MRAAMSAATALQSTLLGLRAGWLLLLAVLRPAGGSALDGAAGRRKAMAVEEQISQKNRLATNTSSLLENGIKADTAADL